MKALVSRALAALLVVCALCSPRAAVAGAPAPSPDRTLSPFFFVENAEAGVDGLPLELTRVTLAVTGPVAEVTVAQVYRNAGKRPLNAKYVFPASTRAAVHGLSMKIGDQLIEAQIQERKRAEATFAQAKKAGKSASLLEQQRPNVFSMSVANVMPGARIEVTLRYTELLVPTGGAYEIVYPTVVGPRYSSTSAANAPASEQWIETPYLAAGRAQCEPLRAQRHDLERNPDSRSVQ